MILHLEIDARTFNYIVKTVVCLGALLMMYKFSKKHLHDNDKTVRGGGKPSKR